MSADEQKFLILMKKNLSVFFLLCLVISVCSLEIIVYLKFINIFFCFFSTSCTIYILQMVCNLFHINLFEVVIKIPFLLINKLLK